VQLLASFRDRNSGGREERFYDTGNLGNVRGLVFIRNDFKTAHFSRPSFGRSPKNGARLATVENKLQALR
jgi:hypothetical protein